MGYPEQFKAYREARGLSREQLSKRAACHRNTVINLESGRPVKFGTITQLMEKMGYPADSDETKQLAILWLEAVTGVQVSRAEAQRLGGAIDRAARQRSGLPALEAELSRRRLGREDIDLLRFAASHRKVLNALKAIRELVPERDYVAD